MSYQSYHDKRKRLLAEAMRLFEKRQYRGAEQLSRKLWNEAESFEDTYCQAEALVIAGNSQRELGECQASLSSFKQILDLPQYQDNKMIVKDRAHSGIGNAHYGLGQYKEAVEHHQEHFDIAQQRNDQPGQGRACGNLGCAYYGLGQYETAIEHHQYHLDIAQRLDDKSGQSKAYANLGCAYERMSQYNTAINYAKKCLEIAQQLDDKLGQGVAYNNLGKAHTGKGQYKTAIDYHQKDLEIAQQLDGKPNKP